MYSADLSDFIARKETDYRVAIEKWQSIKKTALEQVAEADVHIKEAEECLVVLKKDKDKLGIKEKVGI